VCVVIIVYLSHEKDYNFHISDPEKTAQSKVNPDIADTTLGYLYRCLAKISGQ